MRGQPLGALGLLVALVGVSLPPLETPPNTPNALTLKKTISRGVIYE